MHCNTQSSIQGSSYKDTGIFWTPKQGFLNQVPTLCGVYIDIDTKAMI